VVSIDTEICISISVEEQSASTLLSKITKIIELVDSLSTEKRKGAPEAQNEIQKQVQGAKSLVEGSLNPQKDFRDLIAALMQVVKKYLLLLYQKAKQLGLIDQTQFIILAKN